MYKKLERSKRFLKDIRTLTLTNEQYAKYTVYLGKLLANEPLPPEALDHPLKGEWFGYRDLHISGDTVLIYKPTKETVYLTRIGSHAQLFG